MKEYSSDKIKVRRMLLLDILLLAVTVVLSLLFYYFLIRILNGDIIHLLIAIGVVLLFSNVSLGFIAFNELYQEANLILKTDDTCLYFSGSKNRYTYEMKYDDVKTITVSYSKGGIKKLVLEDSKNRIQLRLYDNECLYKILSSVRRKNI